MWLTILSLVLGLVEALPTLIPLIKKIIAAIETGNPSRALQLEVALHRTLSTYHFVHHDPKVAEAELKALAASVQP